MDIINLPNLISSIIINRSKHPVIYERMYRV